MAVIAGLAEGLGNGHRLGPATTTLWRLATLFLLTRLPGEGAEWTWSRMSAGAPTTTSLHTRVSGRSTSCWFGGQSSVWTGEELFVWGGDNYRHAGSGLSHEFPQDFGAFDPDGDGWNHELEWRWGTDPTASGSRPALRIEAGAAEVRISFPDPDPLLSMQLESTDQLQAPFAAMPAPIVRTDGRIHWVVAIRPQTARFFRLAVTTPEF